MLGLSFEAAGDPEEIELFALARQSADLWPDFAERVERLSGSAIGYEPTGTIVCARSDHEALAIETLAEACREQFLPIQRLSRAELSQIEPAVTGDVKAAVLLPTDGQVDPPLLMAALVRALERAGGEIDFRERVGSITCGAHFMTPDGRTWDRVVLATGASQDLPLFQSADGAELHPGIGAILPVKGQMLALQAGIGAPGRVVRVGSVYVAPKARWTLVGATLEPGLSDETTNRERLDELRETACSLLGGLSLAREVDSWAGIRPGTPDGLPMLGESAIPGVFAALGLYRNGMLLAPAVGEMIAEAVTDGNLKPWASRFSPRRFDKTVAAAQSPRT